MAPRDMLHTHRPRARKRKNHLNCRTVIVVVVAANRFTASCVGVDNEPFNVCVCVDYICCICANL